MVADECLHDGGPGPLVLFFYDKCRHAKVGKEKCVRTVSVRPEGPRAGVGFLGGGSKRLQAPSTPAVSSPAGSEAPGEIEFCVF